jgi:quercetin dioxygenase-like cupin family protein
MEELMELIEHIAEGDTVLAYILRQELAPTGTMFLTPEGSNVQVGFVVYPAGAEIPGHLHRPIERQIRGTFEVLVVKKGRCEVDIYTDNRKLVTTRELRPGDVLVALKGGHGFRLLEDTVFLEIKQGPYSGTEEKERVL